MPSNEMEKALDMAKEEFEGTPPESDIEPGLNVDSPLEIQLKKACRLLEASERLLEEKYGYYILIIDACFTAIERSVQALLIERGILGPEEQPGSHTKMYDYGVKLGIFDSEFQEEMVKLWNENRSQIYYQKGLPSEGRAKSIHRLAKAIHVETVGISTKNRLCMCNT